MKNVVNERKDGKIDRSESQEPHRFVKNTLSGIQANKMRQIGPESILESISLGVFTVNKDMQITSFNRAAEVIIGIPRRQAIGRKCSDIFCSNACGQDCPMHRTLTTYNPTLKINTYILNAQGYQIPVMVSTTPLRNLNNEIIGGTETFQDLRISPEVTLKDHLQFYGNALISRNRVMGDIIQTLPGIAAGRNTVFLEGEKGTGKEMLAQTIHALSPHRNKPFITFNCSSQSGSAMEAKLFAMEKRSTDGKPKDSTAPLKTIEGSTLYITEISEMSKKLQRKLLDVLQQNNAQTINKCHFAISSVRLLASTERNISTCVDDSRFCPMLYERISSIVFKLPPLRKRKEDIPFLIDYFISTINQLKNTSIQGVNREAFALLMAYDYPGNIQELRDILERAAILCQGQHITPLHLPELNREYSPHNTESLSMEAAVQAVEVQTIISALKRNKYNRKAAAQDLGIHKSTFFRKIKHLGIVLPRFDGRFRLSDYGDE